jgi:hypothetical protein
VRRGLALLLVMLPAGGCRRALLGGIRWVVAVVAVVLLPDLVVAVGGAARWCRGVQRSICMARRRPKLLLLGLTLGSRATEQSAPLLIGSVALHETRPSGALREAMLQGEVDTKDVSWARWSLVHAPAQVVGENLVLTSHHRAGLNAGRVIATEAVGPGCFTPRLFERHPGEVPAARSGRGRDGAAGSEGALLSMIQ